MSHHAKILALSLVVGLLGLTGCSGSATPTVDPNAVYTQAAGTVQAELARVAALTPSPTATTASTDTPEPTQAPTVAEANPTAGATDAATQAPVVVATATKEAVQAADQGQWVSQNPGDGTTYNPGDTFTMTWKIKNTGTSTWTTAYQLRFFAGDQMGGAGTVAFPKEVKPNDTVEVSVPLKAPSSAGKYLGNWVLTNTDGANFCPITIQINVANAPTATHTSVPATNTPVTPTSVPSATPEPPTATATP